jgi:hypothetical protein
LLGLPVLSPYMQLVNSELIVTIYARQLPTVFT